LLHLFASVQHNSLHECRAKRVAQCAHGFEPIVIHRRIGFDFDCDDLAIPGLKDEIVLFASK
jgi:hypothetical protein